MSNGTLFSPYHQQCFTIANASQGLKAHYLCFGLADVTLCGFAV